MDCYEECLRDSNWCEKYLLGNKSIKNVNFSGPELRLVAYKSNELMGFIHISPTKKEDVCELSGGVLPGYYKKGYGIDLLNYSINYIKNNTKWKIIRCNVKTINSEMSRLCLAFNFYNIGSDKKGRNIYELHIH